MRTKTIAIALLALGAWLAGAAQAADAAAPLWRLSAQPLPGGFVPGAHGDTTDGPGYLLVARNAGEGPTSAPYAITDTLPAELAPVELSGEDEAGNPLSCSSSGQLVTCNGSSALGAGERAEVRIAVEVAPGSSGEIVTDQASVEGGGAEKISAAARTAIGVPAWKLSVSSQPTNFAPGSEGKPEYMLVANNVGGAATNGPVTIEDTLPAGIVPLEVGAQVDAHGSQFNATCAIAGQTVSCSYAGAIDPGNKFQVNIAVKVEPGGGTVQDSANIEGGEALPVQATTTTTIALAPPPFGFLPGSEGLSAPLNEADGSATTQAGSHPHQLTVDLAFPTELAGGDTLGGAGHPRDVHVDLPPGEIVNPAAAPKCTTAQLSGAAGCPEETQIGTASTLTNVAGTISTLSPMYNMVPPPGSPSDFAFEPANVELVIHILGAVRSDGDYGLSGQTNDLLARGTNPILGARLQFWGDPGSPAHDYIRGECRALERLNKETLTFESTCPNEEPTGTALLTAPSRCPGSPALTLGHVDSWEEPGVFHEDSYESADLGGTPVSTGGCNQLSFEPTIEARPTTNLADSPSGLDFDLHQPTDEKLGNLSPAIARDVTVTLPQGMAVNPSSAQGRGACTQAEAHVNESKPSDCPDDAKLASAEVTTPLLPNHPLAGALYLAKPFDNPFGSLLAIYLSVEDPSTGTLANFAGKVSADPLTGQLTTIFKDNPQLPLEDVKLHFFTGPRASFRTPPACGTYSTTTDIKPWSAPETADAHPSDSFAIGVAPGGGACPTSAEKAANSPSFSAGTIAPQAGAFSPFVLKVKREDATQPLAGIDTTLPPGLTGKLAGIATCSEAQIAQAQAKSHPNEGALEIAHPSCPASSEVGEIDAAAGAGITPLHVGGHAYLSGPYKGAPLSLTTITPAVAGPFDLGVVLVRAALYLDPTTTQIHAVSDPFPQILEGIPLDLRSFTLKMGRPNFTLNPTSCDPMTITGFVSSALGNNAGVSSPFQVGGCSPLGFKPKLTLRLKGGTKRGGHPSLKAVLRMPNGGANIARTVVALPRSEFIDQGHFRTICTRVQFAAHACPAGAIYGHVRATSPLVDYAVEGPVYLRSSSNQLPDLVISLHGPPSQPIEVEATGRVDSVNGGIRTSFEAVPDLPVSKLVLEMEGGKKGLFENSTDICAKTFKAQAQFEGQNGKVSDFAPALVPRCKHARRHRKHGHRRHSR
jgi:hypothetical protein